jgi:hypothetical protein
MTEGGHAMDRYISVLATMAIVLLTFGMEVGAAEVSYISGGIGADMREELLAKEKEYNLKIVVAEKSGDYLAGVQIVIESGREGAGARHHDGGTDSPGQAGSGDVHHQGHL